MLRAASRERFALDDDETVFLFVGHDFVRKGLATAIRALGRLAGENLPVRLLVVGKGHGLRRCARLARRWGLGDRVQFVGALDDPLPAYAAADALLLPSRHEPFGLVALEAAACGLPVLLSRMVGASELLTDGREGYVLAEPDDDAAWAARMHALLDYRQAARMSAAARRLALQQPWERSCEEVLAVYHEVCGEAARQCARTQAAPRAA
jgi:UDP-glucose:(heptosyl)LPS alpha-1,3-glucosyltransferase